MTGPSEAGNTRTFQIQGHIVTCSCKFLPTLALWEPNVLIRPAWNSIDIVDLISNPDDYRNDAHGALRVAQDKVTAWLASNPPLAHRGDSLGNG